jgi:hypothetical protein
MWSYRMTKYVMLYKSGWLCFIYVFTIALFFGYIVYLVLLKGGEMEVSSIVESTIKISVVGRFETNFSKEQFKPHVTEEEINFYNRYWYPSEFAPHVGLNDVFIITNVIISPNQYLSKCPQDPKDIFAICNPSSNNCNHSPYEDKLKIFSKPIKTGKCVPTLTIEGNQTYACEMKGWCPAMRSTDLPLKNEEALLRSSSESLIVITNSIRFPMFDYSFGNKNLGIIRKVYKIDDMVTEISKYKSQAEVYKYGAVISIGVHWDCTLSTIWQISKFYFSH